MFDQLSAEIPASLIKGFLTTTRTRTTRTTKQNVDPAVHFVYSRVKRRMKDEGKAILLPASCDAGKNQGLRPLLRTSMIMMFYSLYSLLTAQ
jgi:hypothetical protein